jgi:Bacterial Ig-like domain/Secretion system C-terminal sorting domain/NHL repeat
MKNIFKLLTNLIFMLFFVNGIYAQNTPPTFTSTAITSIDENQTYTYTIATNDVDSDSVTVTAPTLPSWLSLTSATVSTLAGSGTGGFADGTGTGAQFNNTWSVALDGSGNVYVADGYNNRIRKITATGVVSTLAGSGTWGNADGTGSSAQFKNPSGVAVDASGTVYVAEWSGHRIRKITPEGLVSTLAGTGTAGFADGAGTGAQFNNPYGVAVDGSGTVYVADYNNDRIRKITPSGEVSTLAGSTRGFLDDTGTAAQFSAPTGIAVDGSGTVYMSDQFNNRIRKITSTGVVSTLAGFGTVGFADGTGTVAQFAYPQGITVDGSGTVYVADKFNNRIRKITSAGVVSTLAGNGTAGFADGVGTVAQFNEPYGIAVDGSGTVYVADYGNNRIRKIVQEKVLTGDTTGKVGTHNVVLNANDGNGGSTNQSFTITVNDVTPPTVTTLSPADNATGVLIGSNLVLTFSENVQKGTGNILIKDAADNSTVQTIDVTTSAVSITNAQATINPPADLLKNKNYYIQIPATAFTDMSSNAYAGIADMTTWNFATELNTAPTFTSTAITSIDENQTYNYTITTNDADNDLVVITAPTLPSWLSLTVTGSVTVGTLAGDGTAAYLDGTGTAAQFNSPRGVAVDNSGNVYVADASNNRIRKITAAGVVTTLAGDGTAGYLDGTGTAAQFSGPIGVAVDGAGTVYVADALNHRIRKITSAGEVTTLAGSGTAGFADGTGTAAQFNRPFGVAVDGSGTVYVADYFNHRIRKITVAGEVTTLAGSGTAGFADGTGTAAQFNRPYGVAVDGLGTVYVTDSSNNRIRKITAAGEVTTLAGSGFGYADGAGTAAQFRGPQGIAVDEAGTVYVVDNSNYRIRKITAAGVVSTLAGSGFGYADGTGTVAQFWNPAGVAVDGSGTVYVADYGNNRIRKIVQEKVLTGDTTGKVGTHNVVLNANDGNGGSTNQSFTITVNDVTAPTVSTLVPADNATGITSSNLQIAFNENIQKGTGDILIKRVSDDQVMATIPVSGSEVVIGNGTVTITISPTITLPSNTDLYVVIPNTAFTDMSGNAFAGLTTNTLWNFSTSTVLGIEDNIIKGFALYPNPVKGVLNIRAQETLKTIQIFNLMGQQVFLKRLNSNKTTINLNQLPQGTYFIKITTDKTIKSVKLIKH